MKDPRTCRAEIRAGRWRKPTAGLAPGYLQANLVVVPAAYANDFHAFCDRNPRACPLIEATNSGEVTPRRSAPDADLRTDVPRYRIYRDGELAAEPDDVRDVWSEDLIAFLLGCSFSFEDAIQAAGIALRHVDLHRNVSMYVTNRACVSAGPFSGHMVVSMRPFAPDDVPRVTEISARFPMAHGAPVHAGDPAALGIADLAHPDYGDRVPVEPGEVPVFWACGVTPQAVAARARLPLMITHAPGHMFITDLRV